MVFWLWTTFSTFSLGFVFSSPLSTGTAGILDCLNIKESSMKLKKILAAILTCCSTALPVVPGRYLQQSVTWTRLNENELLRYLLWTTSRSSRREQRRKEATFSSSPGPALFGVNLKIYQENDSGQTSAAIELKMKRAIPFSSPLDFGRTSTFDTASPDAMAITAENMDGFKEQLLE